MEKDDVREFLKSFDVLLFDMGDTFMFDCDHFSEDEDFQATYRSLGGKHLKQGELTRSIRHIYNSFIKIARDEDQYHSFPTISDFLSTDVYFKDFGTHDREIINRVFAVHECGEIPVSSRRVLNHLSKSHRLGLISNVWADSDIFRSTLRDAGVYELFSTLIFSSEYGAIKPAKTLFEKAANHFDLPYQELVYIGNNYKRDVVGAKSTGMHAILVNNGPVSEITGEVKPDYVVKGIEELV
jgi:FMN phosphatase YigB (HAD superfamily)